MNNKLLLTSTTAVIFSLLTGCASNTTSQTGQVLTGVGQILSQGQQSATGTPQQAPAPAPQAPASQPSMTEVATVTFVNILMQQMGITQPQAQSGAGMLMQYAQTKMSPTAFSQLQSVSGMPAPANNAPINSVMELSSAFQKQGLSPALIPQMIPVMLQYVGNTGGQNTANSLSSALMKK